jgi:hypothetical protein
MSGNDEGSGWVVEPPPAGTALINLDVNLSDDLTPELRTALEALVSAMQEVPRSGEPAEIEMFAGCKTLEVCTPEVWRPCVSKMIVNCVIVTCPRDGYNPS